ncbi:MAG: sensor domain-containing diguanylate cyclase [Acidobacteria bacterium]|nr:sensor domain-containing diguanylate cyclase [Acidobacteriota bacterium]
MMEEQKAKTAVEGNAALILDHYPDNVVLLDDQWLLLYANSLFRQRFSPRAAAIGTSFLSYLDASSVSRLQQMKEQLLRGSREVALHCLAPDGSASLLQYLFFPLKVSEQQTFLAGIGRESFNDLGTLLEIIQLNLDLEQKQKELKEANARLEQLAITDQITQLYNRHYFFQVAQHFWEESKRYKLPLSVIMMDLDNFKSVNDNYGHLFGDHVLDQAAVRLRKNTRKSDILARYGGEELILLAPNTDFQTALILGERLRLAVALEPFVMGSCSAIVTLSAGISSTELVTFDTFEALLDSSDQALYEAKRSGKNCVSAYAAKSASHS